MSDWAKLGYTFRYHWKTVLLWSLGVGGALLVWVTSVRAAALGIPGPHTTLSGIGVISGWKCDAGELTVRFNGGEPLPLSYGSERQDVLDVGACDHANVGFVSIWNWGNLGDGQHTAVVYDDGVEFDRSTFNVVTTGKAFSPGAAGQCAVEDFPDPGDEARFAWNQSTQHLELVEVRTGAIGPLPNAQERPDLYMPVRGPVHMTSLDWFWSEENNPEQESMEFDFTIHNNVDDWSDRHGLYFSVANSLISGTLFYFGLQTDVYRPGVGPSGKGVIFSRWETRDLAHARVAPGGFTQSSGHEGDFIGVRRPYDWSAGAYRARLARYDSDAHGDWYGLWITDIGQGRTTFMGALRFPRVNGKPTELHDSWVASFVEIYGGTPINPIDIPEWHVSIKAPLRDAIQSPSHMHTTYNGLGERADQVHNTDISYRAEENAIHMRVGRATVRQTTQDGDYNRYQLPPME